MFSFTPQKISDFLCFVFRIQLSKIFRRNKSTTLSGVGRNFSGERKFCQLFIRSTNLIFRALRKYFQDPVLSKFLRHKLNFCKNGLKMTFEHLEKLLFFLRALLKFSYIGAKGAFRKRLMLANQKMISNIYQRRDPL